MLSLFLDQIDTQAKRNWSISFPLSPRSPNISASLWGEFQVSQKYSLFFHSAVPLGDAAAGIPSLDAHSLDQSLSHIWLFVTPWAVACQAPLPMGFSRQEYWNGLLFFSPGNFLVQGSSLHLLLWQVDSLPLSHQGSPLSSCYQDTSYFPMLLKFSGPASWAGMKSRRGKHHTELVACAHSCICPVCTRCPCLNITL